MQSHIILAARSKHNPVGSERKRSGRERLKWKCLTFLPRANLRDAHRDYTYAFSDQSHKNVISDFSFVSGASAYCYMCWQTHFREHRLLLLEL